jgi:hypothetical protein
MKTTRKTIISADFDDELPGEAGKGGISAEVGCVWMDGSGMVDIPADEIVRAAAGVFRIYTGLTGR